jgi:hypothetical protein
MQATLIYYNNNYKYGDEAKLFSYIWQTESR